MPEIAAKLRRYDPEAVCVKCGSKDLSACFHEDGSRDCWDERCQYLHVDHIERHCRKCHFEWYERPLDASPEPRSDGAS